MFWDGWLGTLDPATQLALGGLMIAGLMTLLWIDQWRRGDAGIVDVGWSAGLGLMALWLAATGRGDPTRRALLAALAGGWSLRLASYLLLNRIWGHPEDGRYQALRRRWGARAQRNFFLFFQFQAVLVLVFAIPMLIVAQNPRSGWGAWETAAVLVWLTSVGGESAADRQLARHRARPENRGRTCRAGWWRYSRHPNYFFEWLHWWVYVLLGVGSTWWWATLLGPGLMLFFLFKVTGIPATERQALASRGDDYREYQRTTSAFIPWFPRPAVSSEPPPAG